MPPAPGEITTARGGALSPTALGLVLAILVGGIWMVPAGSHGGVASPKGAAQVSSTHGWQATPRIQASGTRQAATGAATWAEELVTHSRQGRNKELLRQIARAGEEERALALANELYILAGDAARASGDPDGAIRFYSLTAKSAGPLAQHALLRKAILLGETGKTDEAEACFQLLFAPKTARPIRDEALGALFSLYFKTKRYRRGSHVAKDLLRRPDFRSRRTTLRLWLARSLAREGKSKEAAREYAHLFAGRRLTKSKAIAVQELRALEKAIPALARPVRSKTHLKRGKILLSAGYYDEAANEFHRAIKMARSGKTASDARYLLGRVEYRRENYAKAAEIYMDAAKRDKKIAFRQKCLSQAARCFQLLGRYIESLDLYQKIVKLDPKSTSTAWARYEQAAHAARLGKLKEAGRLFNGLQADRRQEKIATAAAMQVALLRKRKNDGAAAISALRHLLSIWPGNRFTPEALLILGELLVDRPGSKNEAIKTYLLAFQTLWGTFHQRLARHRLQKLGIAPSGKGGFPIWKLVRRWRLANRAASILCWLPPVFLPGCDSWERGSAHQASPDLGGPLAAKGRTAPQVGSLLEVYQISPAPFFVSADEKQKWVAKQDKASPAGSLARARSLLKLGLWEEATEELKDCYGADLLPTQTAATLTKLYGELGQLHQVLRWAERLADDLAVEQPTALDSPEIQALLYPWPHREWAKKMASEIGVDPLLVAAIARRESRFNPLAQSLAGARGLMQIVPVTFQQLKTRLRRPELTLEDLFDERTSLELSIHYLRELGDRFEGRPEVVLAAYNAGPANARRWLSQCSCEDPLDFIATISFKETRNYVRFVLDNWWAYNDLYGTPGALPKRMLRRRKMNGNDRK